MNPTSADQPRPVGHHEFAKAIAATGADRMRETAPELDAASELAAFELWLDTGDPRHLAPVNRGSTSPVRRNA